MSYSQQNHPFRSLSLLSFGLVVVSILLTHEHSFTWSWFGQLGWVVIPMSVMIAGLTFYFVVVLLSHRWLGRPSFYRLIKDLNHMLSSLTWWQIIILSVFAGVGEELLFRGFIQSWLSVWLGATGAVIVASLLFALLHAMTLYYFMLAFGMSLLFGIMLNLTQSMLLVVMVHAIYDMIALGVIAKHPHLLGVK